MNFIILILPIFITILLAANCLITLERNKFDTQKKSSKFLLEIMTPVSSVNNIVSETEFILRNKVIYIYIYIMKNSIDPWGTPCFNVSQSEKKN
jgi:hypothetical protein